MRNGKDRKRSSGIKLALEVKGAGYCANPCAKVRVLEKKLNQSWKCTLINQFARIHGCAYKKHICTAWR